MATPHHSPKWCAELKTNGDKLDIDKLKRGKKSLKYIINVSHFQEDEKKEELTNLDSDWNSEPSVNIPPLYPIPLYPNLPYPSLFIYPIYYILLYISLLYSTPFYHILPHPTLPYHFYPTLNIYPVSLIVSCYSLLISTLFFHILPYWTIPYYFPTPPYPTLTAFISSSTNILPYYITFFLNPHDYSLPHPTIGYLTLLCLSLRYAILPRPTFNGWVECKVLAEGKLQHGKWATNGATNDVLPQEAATVKALTDLCPGRTIQMWDGLPNTDLFQYREKNKILRTVASCNGEMAESQREEVQFAAESEAQLAAQVGDLKTGPLSTPTRPLNTSQGEGEDEISGWEGKVLSGASGEDAPVEDASVAVSESERQPPAKEEESKISPLSAPIRPLNTIQGEDGAVISGRGGRVTEKGNRTSTTCQGKVKPTAKVKAVTRIGRTVETGPQQEQLRAPAGGPRS